MPRKKSQPNATEVSQVDTAQVSSAGNPLPETIHTGVNAQNTKTVLVSAVLEVTGQVRFGDGTDVGLTVTETDMVLRPSDGAQLQKFIFAGSKRRGVDRRTIHELRDQHWNGDPCYIPNLCCNCPICWLYGFTGTTQNKNINAKSRVLYASSVSVEEVQIGRNTHSRNQVDEKTQMTAGAAGIHEEEIIVAGVHFPTYTALVHVLDWEIGAFAHAFLENVNSNRYTAASRAQGGMKFAEHEGKPLVIVDESVQGIFPLPAPKIPGWENNWQAARAVFQDAVNTDRLQFALQEQGFTVTVQKDEPQDQSPNPNATEQEGQDDEGKDKQETLPSDQLVLQKQGGVIKVKCGNDVIMTRYVGARALGYLRQRQLEAKSTLMDLKADSFQTEIQTYLGAITKSGQAPQAMATGDEDTGESSDDGRAD